MNDHKHDTCQNQGRGLIKCLIWDLDNTLWKGTLLEGDNVFITDDVVNIVKALDSRGILQSVASRNDVNLALAMLTQFKINQYFIYPQINWNSKASSVRRIQELLNIGMDSIAFIDDQPSERAEVTFSFPEVLCIDSAHLGKLLDMPEFSPTVVTEDSKQRRLLYLSDIKRKGEEEDFQGPKADFLASLDMILTISEATPRDLLRAQEMTARTNQLNTTGYTYSYENLLSFVQSNEHLLLLASLDDKFGTYGKVGLAVVELTDRVWTIKLLLMSCRVMSRGVGTIMLNYILREAKRNDALVHAEMIPNDRNRMMHITLKFAGFKEKMNRKGVLVFENDLARINDDPHYVKVIIAQSQTNVTFQQCTFLNV